MYEFRIIWKYMHLRKKIWNRQTFQNKNIIIRYFKNRDRQNNLIMQWPKKKAKWFCHLTKVLIIPFHQFIRRVDTCLAIAHIIKYIIFFDSIWNHLNFFSIMKMKKKYKKRQLSEVYTYLKESFEDGIKYFILFQKNSVK